MDYSEYMKQVQNALGTYQGNSTFGQSFLDQYRNANAGLANARANFNQLDEQGQAQAKGLQSGLKSMKGSAIAGGALSALSGISNIAGNVSRASQIADTSGIWNQIDDVSRIGAYNYNNFAQLANDYDNANFNVDIDYDDIRGMSTGAKIGNVGGSVASGAISGFQAGGLWGGIIGAAAGLGAGLGGVFAGDHRARIEENALKGQAVAAMDMAHQNLDAAHERISENNNRYNMVNAVAKGGQIQRRRQSILEYANKVTRTPVQREHRTSGIVSMKCNGGVMVRLKAK
jgi:hypothetical protein